MLKLLFFPQEFADSSSQRTRLHNSTIWLSFNLLLPSYYNIFHLLGWSQFIGDKEIHNIYESNCQSWSLRLQELLKKWKVIHRDYHLDPFLNLSSCFYVWLSGLSLCHMLNFSDFLTYYFLQVCRCIAELCRHRSGSGSMMLSECKARTDIPSSEVAFVLL